MAGDSSSGFHHQHHGMLYESSGGRNSICSTSGSGACQSIPMGNFYGNPAGSQNLRGNDGMIFSQNSLDSSSALLLDSVPGLKHDTGLAVEWSVDEQYRLEEGLVKYAHEPTIMQYIKIAASIRNKTVRDVALRCTWMARKRRKPEDQSFSKKVKGRKELGESSLNSIPATSSVNLVPHSFPRNFNDQRGCMTSGVLSGTAGHLLEENKYAFGQISANLLSLKLQENIDLFFHTRNNITKILNDMSNTPGIMSRMAPLPVLLNDDLASSIFPCLSKAMPLGSSAALALKPEPGC